MGTQKLDNTFFEILVIYNMLTDNQYLGMLVDVLKPEYFKDKNIKIVVDIIVQFYLNRGVAPTITEIKAHLDTDDLRASFKSVVNQFTDIDKKFNPDELYENTEKFLKEKAVKAI